MLDPGLPDGSADDDTGPRGLRAVPDLGRNPAIPLVTDAEVAERLAAVLRDLRGYVPDHVWWDAGAADALLVYHALHHGR